MLNSGVCDDNIVEALDELEVTSTTIKKTTVNKSIQFPEKRMSSILSSTVPCLILVGKFSKLQKVT